MTSNEVVRRTAPGQPHDGLVDELLAVPVIRPAAVARGRARLVSAERCPADAVASRLVEDLMGRDAGPWRP